MDNEDRNEGMLVAFVAVTFAVLLFAAAAFGLGYLMFDIIKTLLFF